MAQERDTLSYHGRRSVDELLCALKAESVSVALIHRDLSLLHLERFVAMITATMATSLEPPC